MLRASYSRITAVVTLSLSVFVQCPAFAEKSVEVPEISVAQTAPGRQDIDSTFALDEIAKKPVLVAQACTSCGADLADVAVAGGIDLSGSKRDRSLLTDSLWGNLILELAYQRDKELLKLAKKMNVLNFGTMASVGLIAGGTLAQGIVAVKTLNPPDGHLDSYVPGGIGIGLSGATILAFVARAYFGHKMQVAVENRQLAIKHEVETVLAHIERANGQCPDAQKELTGLIGLRATAEWLQLWRSSHKLAVITPPKISMSDLQPAEQDAVSDIEYSIKE